MIPRAAASVSIVIALCAAGCKGTNERPALLPGWKEAREPRLGFAIAMPEGVHSTAAEVDLLERGVPYGVTASDSHGTWTVSCLLASRGGANAAEGDLFNMRAALARGASVKSERRFALQGRPATEIVFAAEPVETRLWIVAGPIAVCGLLAPSNGTPADRLFFESFRLI